MQPRAFLKTAAILPPGRARAGHLDSYGWNVLSAGLVAFF